MQGAPRFPAHPWHANMQVLSQRERIALLTQQKYFLTTIPDNYLASGVGLVSTGINFKAFLFGLD